MSGIQPLAGRIQGPFGVGFMKPSVRVFLWIALLLVGGGAMLLPASAMAQSVTASGAPLSGVAPLAVNFTATPSPGGWTPPLTWAWDFGDAGTATEQNPTYSYGTPGVYTATVTVTDSAAVPNVRTATVGPITVFMPVEIIATPTCGEAYLNVCFSANAGGTEPFSYDWDFGDGTYPAPNFQDPLPCHTFTTPNTSYMVSVRMVDSEGNFGIGTAMITTSPLNVNPCVTPTNGPAPLLVQFNDGCGFVSGGIPPYSYVWDFGDGSALCYDWKTEHGYNDPGTYHVTLTVTDSCVPPTVVTDTHLVIKVVPGALAGTSTVDRFCGPAPTNACFAGTAIGGTPPYSYSWDFGDGSPAVAGPTPCHVYAAPGNYTVAMTVTDALLATSVDSHIVVSIADPLSVSTSVSRTSGFAPFTAYFSSAVTGGTSPFTYLWDFGDGTTSDLVNPSHVYQPGYYTVKLTVTDGCTPAETAFDDHLRIVVYPVQVTAASNFACGVAPLNVIFTGDAVGGQPPYTWAWTFGDGGTNTQQNPSHSYLAAGTYTAQVTATDDLGVSGTASVVVNVLTPLSVTVQGLPATIGPAPLTVNVSSTVSGGLAPYTYDWDFGDGSQHSLSPSDQHTWITPGTYAAALTVTDACANAVTRTLDINAYGPVTAVPAVNQACGYAPLNVILDAGAAGGVAPYTYSWNFGDGTPGDTIANPSHSYLAVGNTTATVTVTDSLSHTGSGSVAISVTVPLAVTVQGLPATTGPAPLTINVSSVVTGGTPPYTYDWDFADGSQNSVADHDQHTWIQPGEYAVVLTVNDSCGHTVTAPLPVTVVTPVQVTAEGSPLTGPAPLLVSFTGTAAGGTLPYTYDWDFGDGTAHGTTLAAEHTYASAGSYTAKLSVTDANGYVGTATVSVSVYAPVSATPAVNQACGYAPLNVILDAGAAGGVAPYTYSWNFGDGTPGDTIANPSHSYLAVGNTTATVTVTDSLGHTGSGSVAISVTVPLAVTVQGLPATTGPAPLTINVSSVVTGGTPPYTYDWDFADGSQNSVADHDQHTWIQPGEYAVVLTVNDSCGHTVTAHLPVNAYGTVTPAPTVDFACGYAPLNVVFTGTTTGGVPPYAYAWDFGDGGHDTQQNPSHSYLAVGDYTATLTVTDSLGQSGSGSVTVSVTNPLAVAVQGLPTTTGPAPLTVNLSSAVTGGTPPYTYNWDFADGTSPGVAATAQHTWATDGSYDLVLTVNDSCGHTVTAHLPINAYDAVTPTITATATCGTVPINVCFTPSATGGLPPYIYAWSFGDGTPPSADQLPCHNYLTASTYTVILSATDSVGNVGSTSATIQVVPLISLQVSASADTTFGLAPLLVHFSKTISGSSGPFTYAWDFGDGTPTDTGSAPDHLYQTPGTYTVTLTVSTQDACGRVYTQTAPAIQVEVMEAPAITLTSPVEGHTYGASVTFQSTVLDNVAVLRVKYYANGFLLGWATAAPYTLVWDTTGLNGTVSVYATVEDSLARTASTPSISINFGNPSLNGRVQGGGSPYKLKVFGSGFVQGAIVLINGVRAPLSQVKSSTQIVAKGDAMLKAMLPNGVPVTIQVQNPDGGTTGGATFVR